MDEQHRHHFEDLSELLGGLERERKQWSAVKSDECREVDVLDKDIAEVRQWLEEWGEGLHEWWQRNKPEGGTTG